jgi:pimeloyl-ACP methyl ester carboxylesterase
LAEAKPANQVVLFINHGANHHIGWARMHVMLGRRFALRGIDSLRIDISGVGDSPARSDYEENMLYARHSQQDVRAAIDWLVEQGYRTITIVGHCAGAYLGFYSTLFDARVNRLVMLNIQRFFWVRGTSLAVASRKGVRSTDWYRSMLLEPQIWRRLMTAEVNVGGIVTVLTGRFMARMWSVIEGVAGVFIGKESNGHKVVRWFRELSERGAHVFLVYSADDAGLDEVAVHAGSYARKVRKFPNVKFHILDGADHNLTPAWTREIYADLLEKFLTDANGMPSD